jgi:pimeloyl-ACP methyl ester carboxylesterase
MAAAAARRAALIVKRIKAGVLEVAYEESGPTDGTPALLLHGFPYDVHAYDEVSRILARQGCRIIVPYLRGYGPTRFLSSDTMRSGQQAALAHDLRALMDALGVERALLGGFDWGGRSCCIAAALWPERVAGVVLGGGYTIQDIAAAREPLPPEKELLWWYQYYMHGERGRAGVEKYRHELGRLLWRMWSPNWKFDEETYARTARSFDNPDFVDVVVHSYRHRFGLVPGDPALEETEQRLASRPPISVPAIVLHGHENGVVPVAGSEDDARMFKARYERRVIPLAGHNLPQEVPQEFARAILDLLAP